MSIMFDDIPYHSLHAKLPYKNNLEMLKFDIFDNNICCSIAINANTTRMIKSTIAHQLLAFDIITLFNILEDKLFNVLTRSDNLQTMTLGTF